MFITFYVFYLEIRIINILLLHTGQEQLMNTNFITVCLANQLLAIAILVAILLCASLFYAFLMMLSRRALKVSALIFEIIDLCDAYNKRRISEMNGDSTLHKNYEDAFVWFYPNIPSFNEMLYSVKPLGIESFMNKKLIEKLKL